jgi:hypothetical protein
LPLPTIAEVGSSEVLIEHEAVAHAETDVPKNLACHR